MLYSVYISIVSSIVYSISVTSILGFSYKLQSILWLFPMKNEGSISTFHKSKHYFFQESLKSFQQTGYKWRCWRVKGPVACEYTLCLIPWGVRQGAEGPFATSCFSVSQENWPPLLRGALCWFLWHYIFQVFLFALCLLYLLCWLHLFSQL